MGIGNQKNFIFAALTVGLLAVYQNCSPAKFSGGNPSTFESTAKTPYGDSVLATDDGSASGTIPGAGSGTGTSSGTIPGSGSGSGSGATTSSHTDSGSGSHSGSGSGDGSHGGDSSKASGLVECELLAPNLKVVIAPKLNSSPSNSSSTRVCMSAHACLDLINAYAAVRDCKLTTGAATTPSNAGASCTKIFPGTNGTCHNAGIISDSDVVTLLKDMAH